MSESSWKAKLSQSLSQNSGARVAVVGVGHELRGDDAAGVAVARGIRPTLSCIVIDAGPAPENITGVLRDYEPTLVILVDAAQMDAPAGTVRWLDVTALDGLSASGHTLPLSVIARYLETELGCSVALIGIQPAQNHFDAPLSPAVAAAVNEVIGQFRRLLGGIAHPSTP